MQAPWHEINTRQEALEVVREAVQTARFSALEVGNAKHRARETETWTPEIEVAHIQAQTAVAVAVAALYPLLNE